MKYVGGKSGVEKGWALFVLFIVITLACGLPMYTVDASSPTSGALAPTAINPVTWTGTAAGSTTNGESSCVEGVNCDTFTLTISGNKSDWTGKTAHVEINWTTVAEDYDMYVHQGTLSGPVVASSANGTTASEAVDLDPATIGTGDYVVHVLYFAAVGPADQYHGTASVKTATGIAPATQGSQPAPRFQNFTPPQSILNAGAKGTDAGEPSIGVNWKTGKILYQSDLTTFRVGFDDSCPTSPQALWEDKSPATSADSLDPIMFTDHGYNNQNPDTGRTIVSQLAGTTSLSSYTDNDGESWTPDTGGGLNSGVDHQTVGGGGPFHAPLIATVYPHATYYCSQDIGDATCAFSINGGQSYAPAVPIYTLADCGGLHGHVKVGPDGSAYVPNKGCGTGQAVVVSEDNGVTWNVRHVPNSTSASSDPSVALGRGDKTKGVGRLYFGFTNSDSKADVAVSDDNGKTWKNFADVGASFNINNVAFPTMVAGDDDRAALAFLGSATPGSGTDRAFPGFWHLYVATTYDGGLTWSTVDATPNDAVQRGGIWLGGGSPPHRNLLDFIGADVDAGGHIVVGYADGCTGAACVQAPGSATGNSYTALASIARQTGGKGLFANADTTTNLTIPGAPSITVGRDGYTAHVTLSESDNGGSAITAYKIMRGTASGAETLLTTVSGSQVSYNDTTADANTVYYYKVIAVNAQGESCGSNEVVSKPIGSSCTDMKIVTDPIGDQKGTQASQNGDLDIQSVSMSEPYFTDSSNKLVFKMKITDPALQPNRQWRILWNYPVRAVDIPDASFTGTYYVGMNTDGTGARSFEYGTVTTVEAVPANTSSPNKFGSADSSSSYDAATGTITIVLDPVKVGSPKAGDLIGKITGRTFAGNGNTTVLSTLAIDATSIAGSLDPYTAATYMLVGNASCNIAAIVPSLEGDVTARPNGDGDVLTNDLTIMRQFAAHNLSPAITPNEFQRADCAPRNANGNSGDGILNILDLQQARRYAARNDELQTAGGPTQPTPPSAPASALSLSGVGRGDKLLLFNQPSVNTVVRAVSTTASAGTSVTVSIEIDSQGTETGTQFSLNFNPAQLTNPQVALGSGVPAGSVLTLNTNQVANGRIGITIDSGNTFTAGTRQLVTVQFFIPQTAATGQSNLTFSGSPTPESTSDANAMLVPTDYTPGAVNILAPTAADVNVGGRVTTASGRGVRGVIITMTNASGAEAKTATNSFGYYRFTGIEAGQSYVLTARAKNYTFRERTQILTINEPTENVNFVAVLASPR